MHYYIDGYNYIFKYAKARDVLKGLRQKFLANLNAKVNLLDLDVTIVFDSQYERSDFSRTHFNKLEIIFTAYGETADELILQEIKNAKRPNLHTVVTSDKQLSIQVRNLHAYVQTIESFFADLNKRCKNKIRHLTHPKETKKALESQLIRKLCHEHEIKIEKKQVSIPDPKATVHQSFAYYLETFEKRYMDELSQIQSKKNLKNKKNNVSKK